MDENGRKANEIYLFRALDYLLLALCQCDKSELSEQFFKRSDYIIFIPSVNQLSFYHGVLGFWGELS